MGGGDLWALAQGRLVFSLRAMPTAEISETVASHRETAPQNLPRQLTEAEARDEAWNRRCVGILNGTLPPFTDEEIIEECDRRYADLQSGKSRGLTWEEYQLFNRLADEFPHLSDQEIMEEIDRRYEERQKGETQSLTTEKYELVM